MISVQTSFWFFTPIWVLSKQLIHQHKYNGTGQIGTTLGPIPPGEELSLLVIVMTILQGFH